MKNYLNFIKSLLYTFVWIVDSSLCSIFNIGKNSDSGLPSELEKITLEKYKEVDNSIADFKTKVIYNESAILKLTAEDINSLYVHKYIYYSQLTENKKVNKALRSYEIIDNVLILNQIHNLFFLTRKILYDKTIVKFFLEDGLIKEKHQPIYLFNQKYNIEESKNFSSIETKLINFILAGNHENTRTKYKGDYKTVEIIKKLKSIEVKDNQLILST